VRHSGSGFPPQRIAPVALSQNPEKYAQTG